MDQVDPVAWRDVLGVGGGWFFGILVVVLVIISFVNGWIVTGKSLDREIDRSKILNETNENLMATVSTYAESVQKMIILSQQSTRVITALQELPPADAREPDVL
jgi:hypothetical protein